MVLGTPQRITFARSLSVTEDRADEEGPTFQWKQSVLSQTALKT